MVHLQDFGLYPKNIGKPLKVLKLMVCVYVLNFKSSPLTTVLVKLINSRSQKKMYDCVRERKKVLIRVRGRVDLGRQSYFGLEYESWR